jgi:hypothetical protein
VEREITVSDGAFVVHAGPRPVTRLRLRALLDCIPPVPGVLVIDLTAAAFIAEDAAGELCEFVVSEILDREVIVAVLHESVRRELLACGVAVLAPVVSAVEQALAIVRVESNRRRTTRSSR